MLQGRFQLTHSCVLCFCAYKPTNQRDGAHQYSLKDRGGLTTIQVTVVPLWATTMVKKVFLWQHGQTDIRTDGWTSQYDHKGYGSGFGEQVQM